MLTQAFDRRSLIGHDDTGIDNLVATLHRLELLRVNLSLKYLVYICLLVMPHHIFKVVISPGHPSICILKILSLNQKRLVLTVAAPDGREKFLNFIGL